MCVSKVGGIRFETIPGWQGQKRSGWPCEYGTGPSRWSDPATLPISDFGFSVTRDLRPCILAIPTFETHTHLFGKLCDFRASVVRFADRERNGFQHRGAVNVLSSPHCGSPMSVEHPKRLGVQDSQQQVWVESYLIWKETSTARRDCRSICARISSRLRKILTVGENRMPCVPAR